MVLVQCRCSQCTLSEMKEEKKLGEQTPFYHYAACLQDWYKKAPGVTRRSVIYANTSQLAQRKNVKSCATSLSKSPSPSILPTTQANPPIFRVPTYTITIQNPQNHL